MVNLMLLMTAYNKFIMPKDLPKGYCLKHFSSKLSECVGILQICSVKGSHLVLMPVDTTVKKAHHALSSLRVTLGQSNMTKRY